MKAWLAALLVATACGGRGGAAHFGAVTADGEDAIVDLCRAWGDQTHAPDRAGRGGVGCSALGHRVELEYGADDRRLLYLTLYDVTPEQLDRIAPRAIAPVLDADESTAYTTMRSFFADGTVPAGTPEARWQDAPSGIWVEHPSPGFTTLYWRRDKLVLSSMRGAGARDLTIKEVKRIGRGRPEEDEP